MTPVKVLSAIEAALCPADRHLLKELRLEQRAAAADLRRARLAVECLRGWLQKAATQEPRLLSLAQSGLEDSDRVLRGLPKVS